MIPKTPKLFSYDIDYDDTTLAIQYPDGKVEVFMVDEWTESCFSYRVHESLEWVLDKFEPLGDL